MTDKTELIKRYIFLLVGLFVNGLGVSFITKAGLGTSPITSIPYTLSLGFTPTVGMFTLVFNIFLVILQVILLRRNFQLQNLLQLPIIALFSFFIDLTMSLLGFMQPETYAMKVVSLIVGCLILGFGVLWKWSQTLQCYRVRQPSERFPMCSVPISVKPKSHSIRL